jgi:hypothetical protein
MSDSMDDAVSSLSEQTKKLELAQHFTLGNLTQAKEMVAGTYRDLFVIKYRFASSTVYGAGFILMNHVTKSVMDVISVVSQSFDVGEVKTNQNWLTFEKDLLSFTTGDYDPVLGNHVREELLNSITMEVNTKLKGLMENNDDITLNHVLQKLMEEKTGFQNVDLTLDYEPSSSLEVEMKSQMARKVDPGEIQKEKEKEEEAKRPKNVKKVHPDDPLAGKEVKLIVHGSLILSPIKGVDIATLTVGSRIRISITDKNPKATDLLKAFNAITEEGERKPITGRIISIKHDQEAGYKIFAIVAKGIYVRIDEEEESIKVAIDLTGGVHPQQAEEAKGLSTPIIIVLAVVFLVLIGIIVSFLMA